LYQLGLILIYHK